MNVKTKKIVLSAMLAALTFIATIIIRVPMPAVGYVNLGDCFVLLCGWVLGPVYGALAAGIGSAVADLSAGWVAYAPVTFAVKALMAIAAYFIGVKISRSKADLVFKAVSAVVAEIIMIGGYFISEGILYGVGTASMNIAFNAIQGAVGLIAGLILIKVYSKFIEPMIK